MGGSTFVGDLEFPSPSSEVRTVVLVGRTGNGKSATGNSILGKEAFISETSSAGVTSTCELRSTLLEDGKILNVIDTPGLFDFSAEPEFIGKEIAQCINMAKDGIHAVLVVLSVRNRFSREEEDAIKSLMKFFGTKISDYMIVVFTGGDDLRKGDTLNGYLGRNCPEPLKEILEMCGHRCVLFDNRTEDELKKFEQLQELVALVNVVVEMNGGKPYTDELFVELKKGPVKLCDSMEGYEEHIKRITEMVELKLKETTSRLEQQLAEEQAARRNAEAEAKAAKKKSEEEMRTMRHNLERAHRESEALRRQAAQAPCAIL